MSYKPHQIKASDDALALLNKHGMAAIFGLPRTGKTRTSLRAAQKYGAKNVLFLTKKAARSGIEKEYREILADVEYELTVTNYEQVHKLDADYDLVIIDESHVLGCRGRPTNRVKDIRALCYNLPAIFLTGTPTIETPLGIYHQWCVTKYSPFNQYKSFYKFFREYGIPAPIWVNGRSVESYKKHKEHLIPIIERYAVRISQDDAGIVHQAKDKLHVVPLDRETKMHLGDLKDQGTLGNLMIFDTDMGVRTAMHQVEAGAVLYDEELVMLPNTEVVDYLYKTFGDHDDVVFFCHFRSTREKMRQHFKHAQVLSSIANAEGTDMSHMRHVVIVNTGYSGAKFTQLRERVTNMNRTTEAIVHYITTDAGVSGDVYAATSQKKDYNLAAFRKARAS